MTSDSWFRHRKAKKLRLCQGLSIGELAVKSGVSPSQISNIERGLNQPHPRTGHRLAEGLGVLLDDLMTEENHDEDADHDAT